MVRLISDGMMLQRDVSLKIWCWVDPSEKVKIVFLKKHIKQMPINSETGKLIFLLSEPTERF
jgi:sialate O-acetylesterase